MQKSADESRYDISRIERELGGMKIDFHRELGSTNDRGIELARDSNISSPTLVLTEQQLAGRGQRKSVWWSSTESVTFSWCFERVNSPSSTTPETSLFNCPSLYSIAAGLAVAETIAEIAPELDPSLKIKWPNDILIGLNKVAGILIESVARSDATSFIVGIGLNVNQPLPQLPPMDQLQGWFRPSSLKAETRSFNRSFDRTDLVTGIVGRLSAMLSDESYTVEKLVNRVNQKISFLNRKIYLVAANNEITPGTLLGVSADGGLNLLTKMGQKTFYSGSVLPLALWGGEDSSKSP